MTTLTSFFWKHERSFVHGGYYKLKEKENPSNETLRLQSAVRKKMAAVHFTTIPFEPNTTNYNVVICAMLEKRLDNTCSNDPPVSQNVTERIKILKEELEKIIEYRTKGAILRSKSRWYNEGEKNTKYFLNLEKRHFKQGTISQLKLSDGVFVISDKDILSECESFYKDLYASKIDNSVNFDFFQQARLF